MSYITFLLDFYRDFNSLDFQSKNSIMLMSYVMFLLDFYKDFNSLDFQGKNSIMLMSYITFQLDCYRDINSLTLRFLNVYTEDTLNKMVDPNVQYITEHPGLKSAHISCRSYLSQWSLLSGYKGGVSCLRGGEEASEDKLFVISEKL